MSREQQAFRVINTAALQTEIVPICKLYLRLRPHGTGRIFDRLKICPFRRSVHTCSTLTVQTFRRLAIQSSMETERNY